MIPKCCKQPMTRISVGTRFESKKTYAYECSICKDLIPPPYRTIPDEDYWYYGTNQQRGFCKRCRALRTIATTEAKREERRLNPALKPKPETSEQKAKRNSKYTTEKRREKYERDNDLRRERRRLVAEQRANALNTRAID